MDILCTADMCPVILNSTCVFYEGNTLMYTGITTNDSIQTALQKIDAKFGDAMVGYTFTNGVYQSAAGAPVGLGGNLTTDISIGGNYTLTFTGNVRAAKHITTGGNASQFVKGDGTLDSTTYQAAGNYITALTGDVIAAGPGSVAATLATVNSNPGTYGTGSLIPVVTVDTKGRVTALTTTAINVPSGILSFVGDVYGSGVTGSQTTLTLSNVNSNVYNTNSFLKFKVNAKGLVTGAAPITHVDIEAVLGYVPTPETRKLSINGVQHDLQSDIYWDIATGVGSVTASAPLVSSGGANPNISIPKADASTDGYLDNVDWTTFNNKVPQARTLTINGVTYDLSANRSWNIVSMIYPEAGIAVSTGTGWGTSLVDNSANWNTAYSQRISSASAPLSIASNAISISQASGSSNGYLTSSDWTAFNDKEGSITPGTTSQYWRGDKTWQALTTSAVPEGSNLYYTNGRVRTALSVSAPLTYDNTTGQFGIEVANASQSGYLSSTDWNTFNNKQPADHYITDLTGEATATGPGIATVTLSTPAVTGKLLTGVNIAGGTVLATDTILEGFGKLQNQINSLIGGSIYQGTWNAATNTPTLTSGVGVDGNYYIVNVAGNTNLDGITNWSVGDWAIFHDTTWQKVDNTDAVVSVNGYTGAVNLVSSDIPEGSTNLYFTNTRARQAISLTTTGSSGAATYNDGTGVLNIPNYNPDLSGYVPTTRTLTINGTAYDLSANRSWSVGTVTSVAQLTLGTTGTDLSSSVATGTTTPVITLNVPTASATNRGALSAADWTTFNSKQAALSGTGFVKISGTTISYDNSTYALDSAVVKLTGDQSISGTKTFTGFGIFDNTILIKQDSSVSFLAGYNSIDSDSTGIIFSLPAGNMAKFILTSLTASRNYTLPNASGTIALTSDIVPYSLPIATASVLGGIKVGSNLSINATTGVLDATYSYTLPTASTTVLGGVKVDGTTITINGSGVISGASTYSLPIATASVLGGVKIGAGVSVDAAGVISVSTNYAAVNGNTANQFNVFELSYADTAFNPAAAARTRIDSMSIKMWNNYFNGTGLGSDYGTVMQYYSLGGHVESQVYFDAGGASWYRTAAYNSAYGSWQQYITNTNFGSFALPLTGGTLTGALSGTSATFSGASSFGSTVGIGTSTGAVSFEVLNTSAAAGNNPGNSQIRASASSTKWLSVGYDPTINAGYLQGAESGVSWRPIILNLNGTTTSPVLIGQSTSDGVSKLQVTGAATFSSSVTARGTISTTAGNGILSGGGSFAISPSSTRGIIALNGSGDQILTFNTESYIYNNPSLFRMLSTSDIDFVSGGSQRMIIKNTGNVGIGTTSPITAGGSYVGLNISGATGSSLVLTSGSSHTYLYAINATNDFSIENAGAQIFRAGSSERMRITSGGNVLVGTSSFTEVSFGSPILKLAGSRATIGLVSSGSLATIAMMGANNTSTAIHINHDSAGNTEIYNYAAAGVVVNIKSNGNFLIGTTTDNGTKLNVNAGAADGINVSNSAAVLSLSLGNSTNNTILRMTSSSNTFWDLQANTDGTFQIDRGDVAAITFATSRAATFSSSVSATSFFETSDKTVKTLISDNVLIKGIEKVTAKTYLKNNKEEIGYFAQDLQGVLDSSINIGENGLLSLSYTQVHTAKISSLESRVKELEEKLMKYEV